MSSEITLPGRVVWLLVPAILASAACKPPPKPKELQELDRILSAPDANEVEKVPGAGRYYRESRKLRRESLEAYEERNLERAEHLAIRGKLAYQTAEVINEQMKAKKRLKQANQKLERINPRVERLVEERDKLQSEVGQLQSKIETIEARRAGSSGKLEDAIESTETQRQRALRVKADTFAKATFNRADNYLKSARTLRSSQTSSDEKVVEAARKARELFKKAQKEAKPKYEEHLAKMNPRERLQSLREDLRVELGNRYVEDVSRGVRAVVTGLFDEGDSRISQTAKGKLGEIAKIAQEYDEFSILVEGFTRRGNPTQNLTISQVRAKNVRDFLDQRGITGERLTAEGYGQKRIRFPDRPAQNDRVEIVLRLPEE